MDVLRAEIGPVIIASSGILLRSLLVVFLLVPTLPAVNYNEILCSLFSLYFACFWRIISRFIRKESSSKSRELTRMLLLLPAIPLRTSSTYSYIESSPSFGASAIFGQSNFGFCVWPVLLLKFPTFSSAPSTKDTIALLARLSLDPWSLRGVMKLFASNFTRMLSSAAGNESASSVSSFTASTTGWKTILLNSCPSKRLAIESLLVGWWLSSLAPMFIGYFCSFSFFKFKGRFKRASYLS